MGKLDMGDEEVLFLSGKTINVIIRRNRINEYWLPGAAHSLVCHLCSLSHLCFLHTVLLLLSSDSHATQDPGFGPGCTR